ncbi:MAG: hypothetical protein K0R93_1099 [Anaerosolibacter sp.]|jgi:hypothetical protein|uniref:hypothetical protein n=1 Tax=Anaerosolibacter sp. TaxID=1872527 RepID=UPI002618DA16|nr:hypothetical protein [Anaerosolibacter sp.]MDF2546201.1 hypothetical protein [Anaerosolibacter sp.]
MEKKDKNPIRVDTVVQKDMGNTKNYFDKEAGETPGAESVIDDMNMKGQLEAEALVEKYENSGIKTI